MKKQYEVELHQDDGVITLYVTDIIAELVLYSTVIPGQIMSVNQSTLLFSSLEDVDIYIRSKFGDINYLIEKQ